MDVKICNKEFFHPDICTDTDKFITSFTYQTSKTSDIPYKSSYITKHPIHPIQIFDLYGMYGMFGDV